MFGNKKEEDKKEQVTVSSADPKDNPNAAVPLKSQKSEETPEQRREKSSVKMLITYYPDNSEIRIENVQNLTRAVAEYVTERVASLYKDENLANAVVMKLAAMVDASKKGANLWVPGQKR